MFIESIASALRLPLWAIPLLVVVVIASRYMLFAGGALALITVFAKPLAARRIQPVPFTAKQLWREAGYSFLSIIIFTLVLIAVVLANQRLGFFQVYRDIGQFGWLWFGLSIPTAVLIHDFYFYWTHRFMHLPGVFERVHRVHHLSTNPSPLSAFAFHPIEAIIEAGAVVMIVSLIPIHPVALGLTMLYSILTNVMGHLGYELLPRGLAGNRWLNWINTATSHNQHHRSFTSNYGLYTLLWDRLFGTLHPRYADAYAKVTAPKAVPASDVAQIPAE